MSFRVLALDAATEACSVALLDGEETIGRFALGSLPAAPQILAMVEAVLGEAGVSLPMLDGIVASVGPGAFTGVRISVAVAQGLAFGAGLRVAAVTTLEALAFHAIRNGANQALACLDARMGEVYWGCFAADADHGLLALGAPAVGAPQSVVPAVPGVYWGIGRGFAAHPSMGALPGLELTPERCAALPDASDSVRLGAMRLRRGEALDAADLKPLYLRDKVALTEEERRQKAP